MSPESRGPESRGPESNPAEGGSAEGRSRGAQTADRVLSAALEVYAEHGFEDFTITAVIARSGVSSGSVYHHFGNLDGLCAALYWRCMARLLDDLADGLTAVEMGTCLDAAVARAGIAALVRGYLHFVRDNPAAAHFIHASSYARFLTAPERTARAGAGGGTGTTSSAASIGGVLDGDAKPPRMERILGWFRPFIAAGEIADLPESLLEILVIGPVAEISRRWLAGAPGYDLDQAAEVLPDHIWRSIHPTNPP